MILREKWAMLLAACAFASISSAGAVVFKLNGTADATQFGLSAAEPFSVTWSYDPAQAPTAVLGTPPVRAFYNVVDATTQVGSFTVLTTNQMSIDNDNSNADVFSMAAAGFLAGTSISGNINGIAVTQFSLEFLDSGAPPTMFSSLDLPGDASFANAATSVKLDLISSGNPRIDADLGQGSFTLTSTSTPEPASFALVGLGLVLAGAVRVRRAK